MDKPVVKRELAAMPVATDRYKFSGVCYAPAPPLKVKDNFNEKKEID